jgi:hypothetical protein
MIKWRNEINNELNYTKGNIGWSGIGSNIMQNIYKTNPQLFANINHY